MRALIATALALALTTSGLAAAEVGPLSPGKPAGVKQAEYQGDPTLLIVLGVAVAIGIAVAVSSGNDNHGGTTTQTTTGTA